MPAKYEEIIAKREAELRHEHALELDMVYKECQSKIAAQLIEITDFK